MSGVPRPRVTPSGLVLDGSLLPLHAGEIHYFQHDPDDWPRIFDSLAKLGLGCVSTYLPWSVHEIEPKVYDFGETRKNLDIARFFSLAAERELKVLARPGPHINAELTRFGFPRRVLEDPAVMARTPGGNPVWLPIAPVPFPLPSYASEAFLEEVDHWLAEVGRRLEELQWPDGPIVAVQLDNEAPLLFRDGPFDQDYHPSAVELFRKHTEALGRRQEAPPTRLDATTPQELVVLLDWIAFRHQLFARAISRFRETLEQAGLDSVAFFHNMAQAGPVPPLCPTTFDAADFVGFDFYHLREQLPLLKDRCRYIVGSTELPFAAELGWGGPWNLPLRSAVDGETQMIGALACGVHSFSIFMAADRDRYYGAPLDRHGRRQYPTASRAEKLVRLVKENALHELTPRAPVALIVPRSYPHLTRATWLLGPLCPPAVEALGVDTERGLSENRFGFDKPIQIEWLKTFQALTTALDRAGIGYTVVDGAASNRLDRLRPRVLLLLAYEFLDHELWQDRRARVEAGAHLLFGPSLPSLGEDMLPLEGVPEVELESSVELGSGSLRRLDLEDPEILRDLGEELASGYSARGPFWPADAGVCVSLLEHNDNVEIIGIIELEGQAHERVLDSEAPATMVDLVSGERFSHDAVGLDPFQVRLLRVEDSDVR